MIKNNTFREIAKLMFKNWKTLILMITFDILFILFLSSLRFIQVSLDNILFPLFANKKAILAYSISFIAFEFFVVILVYSFFKYFIITFIHEIFKKAEFNMKSFFSFLKLNFIVLIPLIVLFSFILGLILRYLNNMFTSGGVDPFKFVFMVLVIGFLLLLLFIYAYNLANILHFGFLEEKNLRELLKKGIKNSLKLDYYRFYWNDFKILGICTILLLIIHLLVKFLVFSDFQSYIRNFGNYRTFMYSAITLIIYFILLFNRFNFYAHLILKNEKKK